MEGQISNSMLTTVNELDLKCHRQMSRKKCYIKMHLGAYFEDSRLYFLDRFSLKIAIDNSCL